MWFLKLSLHLSLGRICVCITRTDITHYYINPCPKKCRRQSSQKKQIRRLIGLQNGINTSLFPIWREPSPRVTRISPKHLRNSRNHTKLRMHASQNITWFIKHFGNFFNVFVRLESWNSLITFVCPSHFERKYKSVINELNARAFLCKCIRIAH